MQAAEEGLNVRQLEALAAKLKSPSRKPASAKELEPELKELQERLLEKTGMRARLTGTPKKGKIVLAYSSMDELNRLSEMLEKM